MKNISEIMFYLVVIVAFVVISSIPFWLLWNYAFAPAVGANEVTLLQSIGIQFLFGFILAPLRQNSVSVKTK